jgi:hypothetical protein
MQTQERTVGDDVVQVRLTVRELVLVKKALARVELPNVEEEAVLEQAYGKIADRLEAQFAKYHF